MQHFGLLQSLLEPAVASVLMQEDPQLHGTSRNEIILPVTRDTRQS